MPGDYFKEGASVCLSKDVKLPAMWRLQIIGGAFQEEEIAGRRHKAQSFLAHQLKEHKSLVGSYQEHVILGHKG